MMGYYNTDSSTYAPAATTRGQVSHIAFHGCSMDIPWMPQLRRTDSLITKLEYCLLQGEGTPAELELSRK